VRRRVIENRVTKIGLDQKKYGASSKIIPSHLLLKSPNSQHAHAKFRYIQTASIY